MTALAVTIDTRYIEVVYDIVILTALLAAVLDNLSNIS